MGNHAELTLTFANFETAYDLQLVIDGFRYMIINSECEVLYISYKKFHAAGVVF